MGSATIQYEALAEQIEAILQDSKAATAQIKDGETRRRLAEGGRKLSVAMEEPRDTVRRFSYVVCRDLETIILQAQALTATIVSTTNSRWLSLAWKLGFSLPWRPSLGPSPARSCLERPA